MPNQELNKPIKLLVLEENHFEVLNIYIDILALLKDKVEFHLITTKDVFAWCRKEKLPANMVLTDGYNNKEEVRQAIINYLQEKGISIFMYNTILVGDYRFAGQLLQGIKQSTNCKVVLTMHNINALFSPAILHRNILVAYQRFKDYLSKMRFIHPNVDAYNVLCTNQLAYLKTINKTAKPVFYIPPCIINGKQVIKAKADANQLTIAIPGGIEKNRRDYETVVHALKIDKTILPNLKLIILGAYNSDYGNTIYHELEQLQKDGLTLWVSGNPSAAISGDLFTRLATESDIFLCPVNEETSYEGSKEFYGKSKSSGSFYDIVRYRKPAIFPSKISLPKEVVACTLSYASEVELSNLLRRLLNDKPVLENLNNEINNLDQYFDAATISNKLYQNLKSLL